MQDVRVGNCLIMCALHHTFKWPTPQVYVFQGTQKYENILLKHPNVLVEMPEKEESPNT